MPLSLPQRDESASENPRSQRQTTMELRFRPIPGRSVPSIDSAAWGLPVSACSFTQSCRGCLQSKPAGEVIDNKHLSYPIPAESNNFDAYCLVQTCVLPSRLVHKTAHADVHNNTQRQKGEQHRRPAVTH